MSIATKRSKQNKLNVNNFLHNCCTRVSTNTLGEALKDVYKEYVKYCRMCGEESVTRPTFEKLIPDKYISKGGRYTIKYLRGLKMKRNYIFEKELKNSDNVAYENAKKYEDIQEKVISQLLANETVTLKEEQPKAEIKEEPPKKNVETIEETILNTQEQKPTIFPEAVEPKFGEVKPPVEPKFGEVKPPVEPKFGEVKPPVEPKFGEVVKKEVEEEMEKEIKSINIVDKIIQEEKRGMDGETGYYFNTTNDYVRNWRNQEQLMAQTLLHNYINQLNLLQTVAGNFINTRVLKHVVEKRITTMEDLEDLFTDYLNKVFIPKARELRNNYVESIRKMGIELAELNYRVELKKGE